jgi:N-acyl-D-aspartate/D-glutamate deacylase
MLDIKITGGTIVDGTGKPGYRGDVGIRDGRIVAVGQVDQSAKETIDATGKTVSPGFIDVHTHYDAQAFWDPTLSPSCFHGVTTAIGGFCGFSIAPLSPEAAGYLAPMLARVEGMPLETLQAALDWDWRSFGDFLDKIDNRIGINVGFFAGHSAIRRVVMGDRAVGEKCTAEELETMKALLDASLAEGALGFSTTVAASHNDGDGNPVPSRWADYSEIIELARVVSKHEGTGLEFLPDLDFPPEMVQLMTDISVAGQRPLNWNALAITGRADAEERAWRQLDVSSYAREHGGEIIALTIPQTPELFFTLRAGNVLDALPGYWREIFKFQLDERAEKLKDPAIRKQLREDAALETGVFEFAARFNDFSVVSAADEALKKYDGRKIADLMKEEGKDALEIILDIAIADDLRTIFAPDLGGRDRAAWELRGKIWADDRTLIGASDAGAHLDQLDTFALSTTVLQDGVRKHKVITLEQAVHQMTQRAADYFGLIDRGVVAEGYHADLVVFDPATVGRGKTYFRHDLPGSDEAFRLYADAEGIDRVLVNGVEIVRNGEHVGVLPGTVLRSGRDTRTVPMDVLQEKRQEAIPA